MKTELSIITVSKDNAAGLERTIQSVILQKTEGVEYIVVDGASQDETSEEMRKYTPYINIGISEKDDGIYDAMNKGIALSRGEWILFLNAGDTLVKDALANFRQTLRTLQSTPYIIYGDHYEDGKLIRAKEAGFLKRHMPCCHQSTFFRNDGIKFEKQFKIAADYALLRRLWEERGDEAFLHIPYPIAEFDTTGFSSTHIVLQRQEYLEVYGRYTHDLYYWAFWLLTKLRLPVRLHYVKRD